MTLLSAGLSTEKMKHEEVSVDLSRMVSTAVTYLVLAFTVWVFLRLVNACFWLPSFLREQDDQKEKQQ